MGIIKKRNTYYFRGYIPKTLRCIINQSTIDKSLKTKNKKEALQLVKQYELQFKYLMKGFKIALANKNELYSFLDNYLDDFLIKREDTLYDTPFTIISEQIERGYFGDNIEHFQYMLYDDDFSRINDFIKDALEKFTSPLDDTDILDASKHIVKRLLQQEEYVGQRAIDGYYNVSNPSTNPYFKDSEIEQEAIVDNSSTITQSQQTKTEPNLKKYFKEYMDEKDTGRHWSKETRNLHETVLKSLLYAFGDIDMKELKRKELIEYKNKVEKLPRNWGNSTMKIFNDCKTLDEIIKQNEVKNINTLSSNTVKKYISKVRAFFRFCFNSGHINRNIAEDLEVYTGDLEKERRKPYTTDELEKLFNSPFYTKQLEKNTETKIEKVLIPIIALYSGMRLNEIASLYTNDIQQEETIDEIQQKETIYFFDINSDEDKTVKSTSGRRKVPIHPKIIEAGFLNFVHNIKSAHNSRLWVSLKKYKKYSDGDKGRYSKDISDWFQRVNRRYITKDKNKVFHSFRHNVVNNLKQQGAKENLISEMVGHEHGTITFTTYGHDSYLKTMDEIVKKIKYDVPALDLAIKNIGTYIKQKNIT